MTTRSLILYKELRLTQLSCQKKGYLWSNVHLLIHRSQHLPLKKKLPPERMICKCAVTFTVVQRDPWGKSNHLNMWLRISPEGDRFPQSPCRFRDRYKLGHSNSLRWSKESCLVWKWLGLKWQQTMNLFSLWNIVESQCDHTLRPMDGWMDEMRYCLMCWNTNMKC